MPVAKPEQGYTTSPITEYHKLEIEEIFSRTRALMSARIQLFSFIGTAHLSILGIAFTIQKGILIYIAAILMLFLVKLDSVIESLMSALVARGLQLELRYSNDEEAIWVSIISAVSPRNMEPHKITSSLRATRTVGEINQRLRTRTTKQIGVWIPVTVIVIEFIGGLLLWRFNVLPLL